jgi:hypothetical protein
MSWLSEIICGVIFDEILCKTDTPAPTRAVDCEPRRPYVRTFACPLRAQLWVRHLVLRGRS